jgi:hypothetical protein
MVKKLLILGDSFCHGIGTASVFKDPRNVNQAFGYHVARHLGLDYANLAEPGSAIQRAIETGYNYLSLYKDNIDTVIIGWTNPSRLGFYTKQTMLQILPSYCLLGDNGDTDVFVDYSNDVKFITDKRNQSYLSMLPQLHKLFVENEFIDQTETNKMLIDFFRLWLDSQQIKYYDFSVFGQNLNTKLSVSFCDVMKPNRHPTPKEQQMFADLVIKQL